MSEIKSCSGETIPVFTAGKVSEINEVKGAVPEGSVYRLSLEISSFSLKKSSA